NLTSFGAFVEIEPGIDGLVHVSDMSWTRRVEHPSEVVQKGQDLEVLILDIDAENKRISLGVKQIQDDPWPTITQRFAPGVETDGTVARVQDKGVVVDLGDEIEGFVPASHAAVENVERLEEYYEAGDATDLRVLESDAANRRIVLEVITPPERKPAKEEPEPESEEAGADEAEDAEEVAATEAEPAASAEEDAAEPAEQVEEPAEDVDESEEESEESEEESEESEEESEESAEESEESEEVEAEAEEVETEKPE
ncbi:MAG: S1 RNA-binding domain-containing protein, partial [Gemmatimonadota bacterium]